MVEDEQNKTCAVVEQIERGSTLLCSLIQDPEVYGLNPGRVG